MPPKTDGPQMTPITSEEEWAKVCGEAAEKDCLFFVEVYAAWCGPSDAILSTFRKLRFDYDGRKIKFMQVCADVTAYLAKYRSTARPSFLFFKEGEQLEVVEGVNAPAIEKIISDHIPEGMVDTEVDEVGGDGDEEED
mmetsp:Transcript_18564/g.42728  ORF Transcript_18564/g.42728 Transcript_18564/m.42728 type:complete len:138 (+) Transcript_18564:136-549(+)